MTTTNVVANRKRYSGQGVVSIAALDANYNPGPFYEIGRVTSAGTQTKATIYEERNTEDGSRSLDLRLIQGKDFTGEFTLESYTPWNVALRFYGLSSVTAGASVTAESLGEPVTVDSTTTMTVVADQLVYTAHQNITSSGSPPVSTLVLTDSTPTTPVTLVAGTHYAIVDPAFGKIRILSVSGLVMPIKAAYTYGVTITIPVWTEDQMREFSLRFEMINTFDDSRFLIVIYRAQIETSAIDELIQEKGVLASKLTFTALINPNTAPDAALGRFGYVKML